jgi:hypothetical protein
MRRREFLAGLSGCIILGCVVVALAALPPGAIDQMRVDADEAIIIEVTSVTTEKRSPQEEIVKAEARVLAVERSKNKLVKGDTIRIEYPRAIDNRPGPGWPDVLEKGAIVPAFLDKTSNADGKTYEAAAHGGSFTMTPEKMPSSPRKSD